MRFYRFLALPLMFSACALAQSAPARGPVMQFAPVQIQPGPHADLHLSPVMPQAGLSGRSLPAMAVAQANLAKVVAQLQTAPENKVCYAMRSYDFARDGADSDATRLTGSSTCRPSSHLKFKGAVQLKVVR